MPISITSPTGIANMALSHVGAGSIENLNELSPEADEARTWYDHARRQTLEAFDWNFARKRAIMSLHGDTISETSTDPLAGVWAYRYQYPADCLIMRKIQNPSAPPGDATPFDIEGSLSGEEKTILTNMQDAVAVYTYDAIDTGLFSTLFVRTMSHLLASLIAFTLTGKQRLGVEQAQFYQILLRGAAAANANESVEDRPRLADWTRDRSGGTTRNVVRGGSIFEIPDAEN